MILAIDGSFTSSGITLHKDNGELLAYTAIHEGGECYKTNTGLHEACQRIMAQLLKFLEDNKALSEPLISVLEIPAPSKSGFYLAMLHGWYSSTLLSLSNLKEFVTLPPTACDSLIKNKTHSKSFIVKYCKDHNWIPNKRINNDIATASVLCHVYLAHLKGTYKNTVFRRILK